MRTLCAALQNYNATLHHSPPIYILYILIHKFHELSSSLIHTFKNKFHEKKKKKVRGRGRDVVSQKKIL